jgi:hypothetical protein
VEYTQEGTTEEEMNFDQTAEPDRDNIVLACGGLGGWASFIRSNSPDVRPEDKAMQQYIQRAYAVTRDLLMGTPDANTSTSPCDIPDSQLADKLKAYIPIAMRSQAARDRNLPTSLQRVVWYLTNKAPL